MAQAMELPNPARGDIFAFGGKLSISNAATNVFIVYDKSPSKSTSGPSSLQIDFVLGDLYLIDASLLHGLGYTTVPGTLIKGLGLEADGCRQGDTYVKTVYDDIVFVLSTEVGAGCSIGCVAGNYITVPNIDQDSSLPSDIIVGLVCGSKSMEIHTEECGGLQKASSVWSSLQFPSPQQHHALSMISGQQFTGYIGTTKENQTQLQRAIAERDQALRELEDLKDQLLASQPKDAGSSICANCERAGHEAADCIGPVDYQGYIAACPLCNSRGHIFDSCSKYTKHKKGKKKQLAFEYLVHRRANKAPIRSNCCWIAAWIRNGPKRMILPHTRQFVLDLTRGKTNISYPSWKTYRYTTSNIDVNLSPDPDTILKPGKMPQLVPGSQSCTAWTRTSHATLEQRLRRIFGPGNAKAVQKPKAAQAKKTRIKKTRIKKQHALHLLQPEPKDKIKTDPGIPTEASAVSIRVPRQQPSPALKDHADVDLAKVKQEVVAIKQELLE